MLSSAFHKPSVAPRSGIGGRSVGMLLAIVAFFIANGLLSGSSIRTLRDDAQAIAHTHEVLIGLDDLFSSLQDAETGQRGYLLTGREGYLAPYLDGMAATRRNMTRVEALVAGNRLQTARLPALRLHIDAKFAELEQTVRLRREVGLAPALAVVVSDRGKQAMDAVRAELGAMKDEEVRLRIQRQDEMAAAYRAAWITLVISTAVGIVLALAIGLILRRLATGRAHREWVQQGKAAVADAVIGHGSIEELGQRVLSKLTDTLRADAGVLFEGDGLRFRSLAASGLQPGGQNVLAFTTGEGLLGRAVAERQALTVADLPPRYFTIGSALGSEQPRHLVIVPAITDDTVYGVIELGFMQPVGDDVLALLAEAGEILAPALRAARQRAEVQRLLEESQQQAEELQVQSEELRVSNDQLEEHTRALQEQQMRLEHQQVELEQTNAQLEEQAQALEVQRDELQRAQGDLERKAEELERAGRYKSDFLANMSHELRTPLNSMLILSKLLADNAGGNLSDKQVEYAGTIRASGNDLLDLINDILDLSKIEAGHVRVQPEAVLVGGLVADLERLFTPVANDRGLAFTCTVDPRVPTLLETDRQRVEQIVKNLLSNAFKFTQQGSVALAIAPGAPGMVRLAVTDTGIGIGPEQRAEIFEPFRQADGSISRKFGGTGLGLSISRELARLLGGSIELDSEPGQGSTFTLVLPVRFAGTASAPAEAPAATPAAPRPAARTAPRSAMPAPRPATPAAPPISPLADLPPAPEGARSLLVVEDDLRFAGIVRELAEEMGYHCLVAGTAGDAIALARSARPSAIVLDIGLPDQSGLAVLDELKSDIDMRHIPVHVVSGNDHAQTALSLGAIGYVIKPVDREELAEVLKSLSARLQQDTRRVLVVEDDPVQRDAITQLLAASDVTTVGCGTVSRCLELLGQETFDCMVLDLGLADGSGFSLLETLSQGDRYAFPPVIVYTGRELSPADEQRLRRYSSTIIVKGARSPERLLDEVALFLHQVVTDMPAEQQNMIRRAHNRDAVLEGKCILVVEDDIRNIYSLTSIFEPHGVRIEIARNGQEALDTLARLEGEDGTPVDLVLMDVMMPVMDGLTATRRIRATPSLRHLPVIMLTAKAMPDDQRKCLDAGASDYMAKPLDVDKLLSLVRVWIRA